MTSAFRPVIRRFVDTDAPSFLAAVQASPEALARWMPWWKADYALADAQAWIDHTCKVWQEGKDRLFGIFDAGTGAVIGGTGINRIDPAHRTGNIGYWVSTPCTKRGVARFAAREMARFGFSELGLTRLEIVALPGNAASIRVAEAVGAQRECLARNRVWLGGQAHDALVFSLVPEDAARW
ncbi:GNAT family protein [Uliginosibacterium paludis]|uniref:GNAT family protein n=1 Tax=Uliginosibacterium paludis TaxID=1615952 RepID=A0ABV2CNU3_9RHOO